jgi:uncharacterized protein HemY
MKQLHGMVFIVAASTLFLPLPALSQPDPRTGNFYTESSRLTQDPSSILSQAKVALGLGRADQALDILLAGKRMFPRAPELRTALGDLYLERELYSPALEEYLAAENLLLEDLNLWRNIAVTYGRLNQESKAVQYYEKIYQKKPDSLDAIADLGWIYYKTHQLKKGEELLKRALDRFGIDRRLAMTLGTVYSGLYRYPEARQYYHLSIKDALAKRDTRFASVAAYNLAILEKSFNHYEEALQATERSLSLEPRAPGFLSLGDLYQGRMDLSRAETAFVKAESLDDTPLSLLSLANLYRKFGFLDKALSQGKELLAQSDFSWMYYFGTTRDRHLMDIHELLRDTYQGLSNREALTPHLSLSEKTIALLKRFRFYLLGQYHDLLFSYHGTKVAEAYRKEENDLNASFTFQRTLHRYPHRALQYLEEAEKIELAINPESARFYLLERGKLLKEASLLSQSAALFVSPWEKENREEALVHWAKLLTKQYFWQPTVPTAEYCNVIRDLYQINPGSLRQNGLKLPVHFYLQVSAPLNADASLKTRFEHLLDQSGLYIIKNTSLNFVPNLEVEIYADGIARYRLTAEKELSLGTIHFTREEEAAAPLKRLDPSHILTIVSEIAEGVFTAQK